MGTEGVEGLSSPKIQPSALPRAVVGRGVNHSSLLNATRSFVTLSESSDLSRSRKGLDRELVVGTASDPFEELLGWSLDEIRSQWNWVPGSGFLNNSEFSLTWRLARNAYPSPAGLSNQAWQTCPIAHAAAVVCKKWLCMLCTVASKSAHFRVTSVSRRSALIPNS